MPIRSRSRRAVLAGVIGVLLSPRSSEAHAILEASEPKAGATIPPGSVTLKLRYNSRVDRARSGLTLTRTDPASSQTRTSLAIDPEGPPNILTATVSVAPGAYVLHWQVLAIDGHITRGDVAFTVGGN